MSVKSGMMLECDICGKTQFVECEDGKREGAVGAWSSIVGYDDVCPYCMSRINQSVKFKIAQLKKESNRQAY